MGSKQTRLRAFLADHPICCYCGGGTPSSTEDHWPSRSVFDERKWPEGFVFPACAPCNAATAEDEALFALICRWGKPPNSEDGSEQTLKLLKAVHERLPDVYQVLRTRMPIPSGPLHKFGPSQGTAPNAVAPFAVSIDHPDIRDRMSRCIAKLLFSLHYRHTNTIVPKSGGALWQWLTNGSQETDAFFDRTMSVFAYEQTSIKWQKVNLDNQFYYEFGAFGTPDSGNATVFRVSLHGSISICGVIFDDLGYLERTIDASQLARPFPARSS